MGLDHATLERTRRLSLGIASIAALIAVWPHAAPEELTMIELTPEPEPLVVRAIAPSPTAETATVAPTPTPTWVAQPRPSGRPVPPVVAPSATPAPTPAPIAVVEADQLERVASNRGFTLSDLEALPDVADEVRRYRAGTRDGAALEAVVLAIDGARIPDAFLRGKLDDVASAMRAAKASIAPAELEALDEKYLDLQTRLVPALGRDERIDLLREIRRLRARLAKR